MELRKVYEKTVELVNVLIRIVNLQSNVIETFLNSYNDFVCNTDINESVKQVSVILGELTDMRTLAEADNDNADQT